MNKILSAVLIALAACSCSKNNNGGGTKTSSDVIYLENNNFHDGQNAILAYRNNADGTLSALAGSPFLTGGTGIANPKQALGPDDSDDQLVITDDGQFLLAVNPGSNTIAVFKIGTEGTLTAVSGSPFPSGGNTPFSIGLKGNEVFVVNSSNDPLHTPTEKPNYTVFHLNSGGQLAAVAGSTVETNAGSSPSQALVSTNGKFLFGADFLGFMLMPPQGTLRSFKIGSEGKLNPIDGTPYTINGAGGALGLWQHPKADILYVGFPVQSSVGIYSINPTSGALSYQSTMPAGPAACWIRTTKSGKYLYTLNSGENSISVFNSSNAAAPVAIGKIMLKESGPIYTAMGKPNSSSEDFGLAFSEDEKFLYVISQNTNPDFTLGNFNFLHALIVGQDGMLTEPAAPLPLPVDADVRPQGIKSLKVSFYNAPAVNK